MPDCIMIAEDLAYMSDESQEPWMALPLFNRKASPDHTRNVETWFDGAGAQPPAEPDFSYEDLDLDDLPPPSSESSRPHSAVNSDFHCETTSDFGFADRGPPSRTGELLDEIPDEHIPQPVFSAPSRCPFPDCRSVVVFTTGRDFRRHYRQHFKRFFCRYEECSQSTQDPDEAGHKGFATRKDRARHEAKHNPDIRCPFKDRSGEQCSRTFSRMDNMRDHYRRIHERRA